jgi:hypothetical protein
MAGVTGFLAPDSLDFRDDKNGPELAQVTSWGVEKHDFTLVHNGTCMKCDTWNSEPAFRQGMLEEKQGRVHR